MEFNSIFTVDLDFSMIFACNAHHNFKVCLFIYFLEIDGYDNDNARARALAQAQVQAHALTRAHFYARTIMPQVKNFNHENLVLSFIYILFFYSLHLTSSHSLAKPNLPYVGLLLVVTFNVIPQNFYFVYSFSSSFHYSVKRNTTTPFYQFLLPGFYG